MADNGIISKPIDIATHKIASRGCEGSFWASATPAPVSPEIAAWTASFVTYPVFMWAAASAATFPSMKPRWMPVAPHARHLASVDARSWEAMPCLRYVGKT